MNVCRGYGPYLLKKYKGIRYPIGVKCPGCEDIKCEHRIEVDKADKYVGVIFLAHTLAGAKGTE